MIQTQKIPSKQVELSYIGVVLDKNVINYCRNYCKQKWYPYLECKF